MIGIREQVLIQPCFLRYCIQQCLDELQKESGGLEWGELGDGARLPQSISALTSSLLH